MNNSSQTKAGKRIAFFAARKVQYTYFSKLAEQIADSKVIYYKRCIIPAMRSVPVALIQHVIYCLISEKKNSPKRHNKSPLYWKIFGIIKFIEACWLFLTYSREFTNSFAETVVIWNGLKYRQLIAIAAAKSQNIQCVYMENGLLPGCTTIDSKGINYANSVPREPEFFLNYDEHKTDKPSEIGPEQYNAVRPEKLPDRYIFIPFQVNTDSQITRFSPWITDMSHLVHIINQVSTKLGNTSPYFVFKLHPAGNEDYSHLINTLTNKKLLFLIDNQISTNDLIYHSEAVITINSTVGIESLLMNKKVIVLGNAFYNIRGLTLKASDQKELVEALRLFSNWLPDKKLRHNFFRYLYHEYQIPGRWQECSDAHQKAAVSRIIQAANNE